MEISNIKSMKILIHGTRGKSSLVRCLHKTFTRNEFSVISRETGLNTIVYTNDRIIVLEREKRYFGMRNLETSLIISKYMNSKNYQIKILENNSISLSNTINIARFFKPNTIIITTWGVDHIENQGYSIKETFQFYLREVSEAQPKLTLFWTNFKREYEVAKRALKNLKIKKTSIKLLFSSLEERDNLIIDQLSYFFDLKVKHIKNEEEKEKRRIDNIINIGDINDPESCLFWLNNNLNSYNSSELVFVFNLRCDRKDRTFAFLEIVYPQLPKKSEKITFVEDVITYAYCESKGIKRIFSDPKEIINYIERNKDYIFVIMGNTVNSFGKMIIEKCNRNR